MNGLGALVEQFSLPEISRVLKRTVYAGLVAGAVAVVVAGLLGHILFGIGAYIGLAVGLANIRAITSQTARVAQGDGSRIFRALASMTLFRLGATTVVVIVLIVLNRQLGLGSAVGLCAFYLIFVLNIATSILRHKAVP
ncbi:MAG: hypothetical protein ABSH30_00900 [Acidimicrobiales bacterium]|jgi:hypothetical protein